MDPNLQSAQTNQEIMPPQPVGVSQANNKDKYPFDSVIRLIILEVAPLLIALVVNIMDIIVNKHEVVNFWFYMMAGPVAAFGIIGFVMTPIFFILGTIGSIYSARLHNKYGYYYLTLILLILSLILLIFSISFIAFLGG